MTASPGPLPDLRAPQPGAEGLAEPMRSRWSPSVFAYYGPNVEAFVAEFEKYGRIVTAHPFLRPVEAV